MAEAIASGEAVGKVRLPQEDAFPLQNGPTFVFQSRRAVRLKYVQIQLLNGFCQLLCYYEQRNESNFLRPRPKYSRPSAKSSLQHKAEFSDFAHCLGQRSCTVFLRRNCWSESQSHKPTEFIPPFSSVPISNSDEISVYYNSVGKGLNFH